MKRALLWLMALVLFASASWARDIRTLDGKIYKNAVVTRVEATGIRLTHDEGVGFIDFNLLPDELKKEFGYSQEAYAVGVAAQKQADAAFAEARRQADLASVARQREKEGQQVSAVAMAQANVAASQPKAGGANWYDSALARPVGTLSTTTPSYSSGNTYTARDYSARNYAAPTYSTGASVAPVNEAEKTQHVGGYYRKDGTYVHSYNRRPASR